MAFSNSRMLRATDRSAMSGRSQEPIDACVSEASSVQIIRSSECDASNDGSDEASPPAARRLLLGCPPAPIHETLGGGEQGFVDRKADDDDDQNDTDHLIHGMKFPAVVQKLAQ